MASFSFVSGLKRRLVLLPLLLSVAGFLLFLAPSDAFQSGIRHPNGFRRPTALVTVKTRPLSTVDTQSQLGNIPRLEIGLRVFKTLPKNYYDIKFINPVDWLASKRMGVRDSSSKFGSITNGLFQQAKNFCSGMSGSINNFFKIAMSAALMMVQVLNSLEVFKFLTLAFSTVLAILAASPFVAHASALLKNMNLEPTQKLATTPLYYVCNSEGQAYVQEDVQAGKPNQKAIVYYMSSQDANDYLNEIAQSSPGQVNEFRIMATSMEKVVGQIQSRKQSRKMGRLELSTVYRIQPSARQCATAEKIAGGGSVSKGRDALEGVSIPMFSAKGLGVKRSNGEFVTPYYFAYEDLLEDWKQTSKSGKAIDGPPAVVVHDFVEVLCLSKGIGPGMVPMKDGKLNYVPTDKHSESSLNVALKNPAIIPPRQEIAMLKSYYRNDVAVKGMYQPAKIFS